jgi:hypothetical protein
MSLVFPYLREHDGRELQLLGPEALVECFEEGEVYIGWVDKSPACVWGVRYGGLLDPAHLWMMSTPLVEKYRVSFVRLSTRFVMETLQRHGTLRASVMHENKKSIRWMKWLGFDCLGLEDSPVGPVFVFERSL